MKDKQSQGSTDFAAFENETQSTTVGPGAGLTFENHQDAIVVYGDFEITKDSSPQEIDSLVDVLMAIRSKLKS